MADFESPKANIIETPYAEIQFQNPIDIREELSEQVYEFSFLVQDIVNRLDPQIRKLLGVPKDFPISSAPDVLLFNTDDIRKSVGKHDEIIESLYYIREGAIFVNYQLLINQFSNAEGDWKLREDKYLQLASQLAYRMIEHYSVKTDPDERKAYILKTALSDMEDEQGFTHVDEELFEQIDSRNNPNYELDRAVFFVTNVVGKEPDALIVIEKDGEQIAVKQEIVTIDELFPTESFQTQVIAILGAALAVDNIHRSLGTSKRLKLEAVVEHDELNTETSSIDVAQAIAQLRFNRINFQKIIQGSPELNDEILDLIDREIGITDYINQLLEAGILDGSEVTNEILRIRFPDEQLTEEEIIERRLIEPLSLILKTYLLQPEIKSLKLKLGATTLLFAQFDPINRSDTEI